jgi:hypothetical protein
MWQQFSAASESLRASGGPIKFQDFLEIDRKINRSTYRTHGGNR